MEGQAPEASRIREQLFDETVIRTAQVDSVKELEFEQEREDAWKLKTMDGQATGRVETISRRGLSEKARHFICLKQNLVNSV